MSLPSSLPALLTAKHLALSTALLGVFALIVFAAQAGDKDSDATAQSLPIKTHVEMGQVDWLRDYDKALAQSKEQDKPVMLLFQEVPGCLGCREYGKEAMSHPLIVEGAESLFIPLCIHNNKGGADAKILKQYNEPAWNYPVVRYVDGAGKDLIPRADRVYSTQATAARMVSALKKDGQKVPAYLQLLADEGKDGLATATFQMGCFWHGQARLGGIDGVVTARAGWAGAAEVVELTFDPKVVRYEELVKAADSHQCAVRVYAEDAQQKQAAKAIVGNRAADATRVRDIANTDAHQYRHLRRTAMIHLPLTTAQATKANAAIEAGRSPLAYLSPAQVELLKRIEVLKASGHANAFDGRVLPADAKELAVYQHRIEQLVGGLEAK